MNSTRQPAPPALGLPPEQFAAAFPFHFAVNARLEIVQVGASLKRVCADVHPGARADRLFRCRQPEGELTGEFIAKNASRFFLLEHGGTGLPLRGEFIAPTGGEHFLFLGSPWLGDAEDISKWGLSFEDFAVHDPAVDILQVLQLNRTALVDMKKLNDRLAAQRAELRAANERLRAQEADSRMLALIAKRTTNAVVLTDVLGRYEWVNEGFTRITGFTLPEVVGKTPGSVLQGPETDPTTVQFIHEQLRKGEGFSVEIINYSKTRRKYWLAIEGQPIRDEAGQLVGFMAIENDITQRKEMEAALQEEVAKRRSLFEQAAEGIVIIDPQTAQFLEFNTAAHEQLGYTREEFSRLSIFEVEAKETAEKTKLRIAEVIQKGRVDFETLQRTRQGEVRNVQVTAQVVEVLGQTVYQCLWRDITERKLAEDKLRQLSRVVEQSPVSIVITTPAGVIEYVNPQCLKITGYTEAELLGQNPRVLKSGDATPETYRELWGAITAGKEWRGEFHNKKKNGELFWENAFISAIRDDAGRITHFLAIKEDITERKRLEVSLGTTSERLVLAARAGGVGIWDYDVIANRLSWDHQMYCLYGITHEQFGGAYEAWQAGIHPEDRQRSDEEIQKALRGEKELDTEFRVLWPDGSTHFIRAFGRVQRDNTGKVLRMIGTNWDITERKNFETLLLETTTLQRAMIEGAGSAIIATDTQGVIRIFNPAAERILGYTAAEMVGKHTPGVFHDAGEVATRALELTAELGREVKPGFEAFVAKSELGQPDQREWTYVRKDGWRFPVLLSVTTLFDDHGKITGYLGLASDLTERKQAEEKIRATLSELERFNRVMVNREERVLGLKREVNQLLAANGRPPAYLSATENLDNPKNL